MKSGRILPSTQAQPTPTPIDCAAPDGARPELELVAAGRVMGHLRFGARRGWPKDGLVLSLAAGDVRVTSPWCEEEFAKFGEHWRRLGAAPH